MYRIPIHTLPILMVFFCLSVHSQSYIPFSCGNLLTDNRNGKNYPTVSIGKQCWMSRNLDIGTLIAGSMDPMNNKEIEKYCYDDLPSNCDIFGGLYQWNEMMQYSLSEPSQGICPDGWHIPSDAEWSEMIRVLGENNAGGKMKETGTSHWVAPNEGATNSSGFSALPAGFRLFTTHAFMQKGQETNFWSSSQNDPASAIIYNIVGNDISIIKGFDDKRYGYSVRCLKN